MSKVAVFFFGLIAASQALACPNVSGIFRNSDDPRDKGVFWLEQTQCEMLKKTMGTLTDHATVELGGAEYFPLNGSAVCHRNTCQYVTAEDDAIVWKNNFNSTVVVPVHGKCIHNGYRFSKMANGDLKAVFQVRDCSDRYQGMAEKVFPRL